MEVTRWKKHETTHASKVVVQELHIAMDDLEHAEFVVVLVHAAAEVEGRVPKFVEVGSCCACKLTSANNQCACYNGPCACCH